MNNIKNSKKLKIFIFLAPFFLIGVLAYIASQDNNNIPYDVVDVILGPLWILWFVCFFIMLNIDWNSRSFHYTYEIKRNIYDSRGKITGYIGTGEYDDGYKEAKISENQKKTRIYFVKSIYSIIFTATTIISCCISSEEHPIWFGVTLGIITLYALDRYIINQKFKEYVNFYSNIFYYSSIISALLYFSCWGLLSYF